MKFRTILFTTLPTVLVKLPGGNLVTGMFFLLVAFAALTSTISLMEVVSSYAIDELRWTRHRAQFVLYFILYRDFLARAERQGARSAAPYKARRLITQLWHQNGAYDWQGPAAKRRLAVARWQRWIATRPKAAP